MMPNDWQVAKLKDISEFRRGSFPQPYGLPEWYDDENGFPFVQVYDVDGNGRLKPTTKRKISKAAAEKSVFVPAGTILITIQGSIGRVAITQYDAYVDRTLLIISKLNEEIDKTYFSFILRELFELEAQRAPGGTIKTITKEALSEFTVQIPPKNEQEKIAEILSTWDEAIQRIDNFILQKSSLKTEIAENLLSGKVRFKSFNKKWGHYKLSELFEIKHGYAFEGEFFTSDATDYILLTPGNFHVNQNLYFGKNTKYYNGVVPRDYILSNGDLLIVMTDLTKEMNILGNSVILKSEKAVLHNQRIGKVINLNSVIAAPYLNHLLNSSIVRNHVKSTASGSTVRHTSPSRILEVKVFIPDIEEQKAIHTAIDSSIDELSKLQLLRKDYQIQKQGLMQQLLTGKKRVKVD